MKVNPDKAYRDDKVFKLEPHKVWHPDVQFGYQGYMHKCRLQSDGVWRNSDNWQNGFMREDCTGSLVRHTNELWGQQSKDLYHQRSDNQELPVFTDNLDVAMQYEEDPSMKYVDPLDTCYAIIFNASAIALSYIREREGKDPSGTYTPEGTPWEELELDNK